MPLRPSLRLLLLLPVAAAGLLGFTGCADDDYDHRTVYERRPAYYDEGGPSVDFVFQDDRPYSRYYGPLYYRDGGYYYQRGGSYIVYDRPVPARYRYSGDRHRVDNRYYSNRETRVENRVVNNNYRVYDDRHSRTYRPENRTYGRTDGSYRPRTTVVQQGGYHPGGAVVVQGQQQQHKHKHHQDDDRH